MARELIQVNSRRPATRVFLIVLLVLVTIWCYFVLRWYLGNTLAEYFNATESNIEMARLASSLAPDDPLAHWRLGQVYQAKLPLDQSQQAIAEYEKAVSLAPNDYRFWTALGTAHEQSGDQAKGEQALRRAVALAPSYSYPHWYLGNLLLRSGRYGEAFTELRVAADADPQLRPQLFNLILAVYGNDFNEVQKVVAFNAEAKAQFAVYLLGQKRLEDSLAIWNSLAENDKKANRESGEAIVSNFIGVHRYHDAMNVWNSIAVYRAEVGKMVDGGFEEAGSAGAESVFAWQVQSAPQMQIGIDPNQAHSGVRSLRLSFQVRSKMNTLNASELVPVAADTSYEFECYVRTEKLESGSTPFVQISDATDGAVLATSDAAPNGNNEWSRLALSFKTGAKTEAIMVRLARTPCGDDGICPIFGAIWYDDFSIKRRD